MGQEPARLRAHARFGYPFPTMAGGQDPPADPPAGDPPKDPPADPPKADPPKDPPDGGKTFSEDYVKTLRGESAGYRTRAQEAEAKLKQIEDAGKTDAEKAARDAEANAARVTELETERDGLLRELIAAKHGLDDDIAGRLQGTNREELEADAKALAKKFGSKPGGWDGGRRGGDPPPALPEDADPLVRLSHAYSQTK